MTRDELLAALLIERYAPRPRAPERDPEQPPVWDDSELTTARRRRALVAAWDEHKERAG